MRYIPLFLFILSISISWSQGYKPKKSKKDFFGGARDYRSLSNKGLQIQFGPTFTIAQKKQSYSTTDTSTNLPFDAVITPKGLIGAHIEIGMAHFNVKKPFLRIGKLYHYFDYGIGFKLFGGKETTDLSLYDASNRVVGNATGSGKFYNGYVGLRASIHYLKYFQNGNKFLDNGLGINGEYQVLGNTKTYTNFTGINSYYSNPLRVQLHYKLGFGFRLKRGSYLIPTIQIPILGFSEFGHESIRWFSSKYYPIMVSIKWIKLFKRKSNDCMDNGTEQDRKKNEEYLQGK